jgi:formylglycine-generating enzyme required for sulfatase activity
LDGGSTWLSYNGEVTLSSNGTYEITARQTAGAGNVSPNAATVTVTINIPRLLDQILVTAGNFMMGSPANEKDRDDDERQHRVEIERPFYIGKYEVTQEQWQTVTGDRPWQGQEYAKANPKHAVNYISWNDCQSFLEKLNAKTGLNFVLPTEAEWEYACRAGTTSRFYYGDDPNYSDLKNYAWFADNAYRADEKYPHAVGQKKPNTWGLHDMHGNVWEWCSSLYKVYPYRADDGRENLAQAWRFLDGRRVLRGGSWDRLSSTPRDCRSAGRGGDGPPYRDRDSGCRLLLRDF